MTTSEQRPLLGGPQGWSLYTCLTVLSVNGCRCQIVTRYRRRPSIPYLVIKVVLSDYQSCFCFQVFRDVPRSCSLEMTSLLHDLAFTSQSKAFSYITLKKYLKLKN